MIITARPTITHAFEIQLFISMDSWQVLPLKLICAFSLITLCWYNIHHWWCADKIVISAVKRCLVDLVTTRITFHHHCRLKACKHKSRAEYLHKHKQFQEVEQLGCDLMWMNIYITIYTYIIYSWLSGSTDGPNHYKISATNTVKALCYNVYKYSQYKCPIF